VRYIYLRTVFQKPDTIFVHAAVLARKTLSGTFHFLPATLSPFNPWNSFAFDTVGQ
jgi:hypothetical protein